MASVATRSPRSTPSPRSTCAKRFASAFSWPYVTRVGPITYAVRSPRWRAWRRTISPSSSAIAGLRSRKPGRVRRQKIGMTIGMMVMVVVEVVGIRVLLVVVWPAKVVVVGPELVDVVLVVVVDVVVVVGVHRASASLSSSHAPEDSHWAQQPR